MADDLKRQIRRLKQELGVTDKKEELPALLIVNPAGEGTLVYIGPDGKHAGSKHLTYEEVKQLRMTEDVTKSGGGQPGQIRVIDLYVREYEGDVKA